MGIDCQLVYVIDGFSTDETQNIVSKLAKKESRIQIFYNNNARTLVDSDIYAYERGMECNSDWVLDINAGYRHQPKDLQKFLKFARNQNIDAVFGSRYLEGGTSIVRSRQRRILSKEGTRVGNCLLGTQLTDLTSGFMMIRRNTLVGLFKKPIKSKYHFLQTEIKFKICQITEKIAEVPIEYKSVSGPLKWRAIADAAVNLSILTYFRISKGVWSIR